MDECIFYEADKPGKAIKLPTLYMLFLRKCYRATCLYNNLRDEHSVGIKPFKSFGLKTKGADCHLDAYQNQTARAWPVAVAS